jgi:stage II sporulation protein AB (anti-sigma F factor)
VKDKGTGIANISLARTPLYTTDAEGERSGMGFTVMESFTDRVKIRSAPGKGTTVILEKRFDVK